MKRCKHENGELVEMMTAGHYRTVENGIMEKEGPNEMGNINGYYFDCADCGKTINDKGQKWMKKYKDAL